MSDFGTGGAGCAAHPNVPAVAVCDRCGGYMCEVCNDGGLESTCPSCRQRTGIQGFPLSRDAWSLDRVFTLSWQAYSGAFGPLVVGELVAIVVGIVLSFVPQLGAASFAGHPAAFFSIYLGGTVLQYGIQGILQLGIIDMGFDSLEGYQAHYGTLIGHAAKVGRLLLQYVLAILVLVVPMVLYAGVFYLAGSAGHGQALTIALVVAGLALLYPTFWLLLPLIFLQYELALDDDVGALESVRRCFVVAQSKRLAILGMSILGFIVMFSGAILCGVGVIFTVPLGQVIMSALYLALRNGSGLPPPVRRGDRARNAGMGDQIFAAIPEP